MICRKCGTEYDAETIGFKAACENCLAYLHSCFQCTVFDHNAGRCRSLTADISRGMNELNFCEEFVPNSAPADNNANSSVAGHKRSFNDLFGKRKQ